MLSAGAALSSVKLSVAVTVLPARLVCVAVRVCAPSRKPDRHVAPRARAIGGRRAEGGAALLDRHHRAGLTNALDRRVRGDLVGCRTAGIRSQPNRECGLGPGMRRIELRLSRQELVASLRIGAGGDLTGGQPEEFVVGDLRYSGCRVPHGEGGVRGRKIIEDCIAAYEQLRTGMETAFLSDTDDDWVMRGRALLDDVILDYGVAAVRQVNAVTGGPIQVVNT